MSKSVLTKEDFDAIDDRINAAFERHLGEFAIMVGNGFADTQRQLNEIREEMATKKELNEFKEEMGIFKNEMHFFKDQTERSFHHLQIDVSGLKDRMSRVEIAVEPIPDILEELRQHRSFFQDHEGRICRLEGIAV